MKYGNELSLSIAYALTRRLGGDITVQSQLRKGTEFDILIKDEPEVEELGVKIDIS